MQIAALITIGAFVAFVAGALGIGGGILTVPALYYVGRLDGLPPTHVAHIAVAASLAFSCLTNVSAALSYLRQGRVRILEGALLVSGSVLGAFAVSQFAVLIPTEAMATLFGTALLANGLWSLRTKTGREATADRAPAGKTPLALLVSLPLAGLAVGILAGTTGVGGGVVVVPLLSRGLRFPVKQAIATSSATIVLTALAGTIGFVTATAPGIPQPHWGYIYLPYAVPLSLGALAGGYLGANFSGRTRPVILVRAFAILQIVVGIKLLWDTYAW